MKKKRERRKKKQIFSTCNRKKKNSKRNNSKDQILFKILKIFSCSMTWVAVPIARQPARCTAGGRKNYLILRSQKLKNENIFTGKNISVLFVVIC